MTKSARSVSPQSKEEEPAKKKQKGSGFSRLLGFFKSSTTSPPTTTNPIDDQITTEIEDIDSIPLVSEFPSSKKKRMSIHALAGNNGDNVPRSVSISNNLGFYQSYYNSIQTEREELSKDLERRLSSAYDNGLVQEAAQDSNSNARNYSINPAVESLKDYEYNSRDISPLLVIPTANNTVLKHFVDEKLGDDGPIIIEHEFPLLYTDGEGNLARPPFINLDPRERYHLVQLKRSIEASESLQNRLKYMVDPQETKSVNAKKNTVETSTQTHTISYMEKALNFPGIKRKLTTSHRHKFKVNKKQKNVKGFFSGEHVYDLVKDKKTVVVAKVKNKLDGYLGNVNKPEFKGNSEIKDSPSITVITIGNDEDKVNKFNVNQKITVNERVGLNDFLVSNITPKLSLDPEYITESDRISNIIKLKDIAEKKAANIEKPESSKPSSGFKFEVNKSDINEIIGKRKQDEESTVKFQKNTAKEAKPDFEFGASKTGKEKPSFSFGENSKNIDDASKIESAPKLSFGTPKSSTQVAPKFSFGKLDNSTDEAPKLSLDKTTDNSAKEAPKFSFGKKDTEESAPKFSFGKPTEREGGAVESKKSETPKFSFGSATESKKSEEAGKFSFGSLNQSKKTEETPKFSFGTVGGKNIDPAEPVKFSFGAPPEAEKSQAPKFSFGTAPESTSESPKLSFGTALETKKSETPKFSFGDNTEPKQSLTEAPKVSFAGSVEPEQSTVKPKPSFNFGSQGAKPAFSIGATPDTAVTNKPKFSLQKSETSKSGAGSEEDPEPKSKRTNTGVFGATPPSNTESTPFGAAVGKLLFGPTEVPKASAFSFKPKVHDFTFGSLNKDSLIVFGSKPTAAPVFGSKPTEVPAFGLATRSKEATPFESGKKPFTFGGDSGGLFDNASKPAFSMDSSQSQTQPAFPFGDNKDAGKPFGSATPNSRTATPFGFAANSGANANAAGAAPGAASGSVFGNVPSKSTFDFQFGGGATPTAPVAAPTAFAPGGVPGSGFFNRSASNTPPIFGFQNNDNGMNMNPAMNTPNSQLYTPPIIANRNPNRKIAQMRPRRR